MDDLAAITCFFSYVKNSHAVKRHEEFKARLQKQGVTLYTIELAFFDEDYLLGDDVYLRLRTNTVLWHKECLLNILVKRLPPYVKKVAWLDCDIEIADDEWPAKVSSLLNEYKIVQLGREHLYLAPNGRIERKHSTLGYGVQSGAEDWGNYAKYHPGLGWASSRELFSRYGGLFEYGLSGGADGMMGYIFGGGARTGEDDMKDWILPRKYKLYEEHSPSIINKLKEFRDKTAKYVNGSVTYLDTKIRHKYHAPQGRRGYLSRPNILKGIDLYKDVSKDESGLFKWRDMRYNLVFKKFFSMKDNQEQLRNNISYKEINIESIL